VAGKVTGIGKYRVRAKQRAELVDQLHEVPSGVRRAQQVERILIEIGVLQLNYLQCAQISRSRPAWRWPGFTRAA
jgi:hypothetical protein